MTTIWVLTLVLWSGTVEVHDVYTTPTECQSVGNALINQTGLYEFGICLAAEINEG